MSLSSPRIYYGVNNVTAYNIETKIPYGTMKVLQGSNVTLAGETVSLTGGANRYPWAIEDGKITTEISLTFNEYPNWVYELFLGKAPTDAVADSDGEVGAIANGNGTSAVSATTGILSATAKSGSEADLKFGKYAGIVLSGGTTVDVYASSDIDFARGTDLEFVDDTLKITSTPLTITTDTAVEVPSIGVELTGGSGTIGMTEGDTFYFEVLPINTKGSSIVTVGGTLDVFPEFGLYIYGQMTGGGSIVELDCFKCKSLGAPLGFTTSEFSETEVTISSYYDSSRNGVFSQRLIL